jgi:hypothetical protein
MHLRSGPTQEVFHVVAKTSQADSQASRLSSGTWQGIYLGGSRQLIVTLRGDQAENQVE